MQLDVVLAAEPPDIPWTGIIVVMGFGLGSTLLTGLRRQNAQALERFDVEMCRIAPGIFPAPLLLACEGLGHRLPSTKPVRPSSDRDCLT